MPKKVISKVRVAPQKTAAKPAVPKPTKTVQKLSVPVRTKVPIVKTNLKSSTLKAKSVKKCACSKYK